MMCKEYFEYFEYFLIPVSPCLSAAPLGFLPAGGGRSWRPAACCLTALFRESARAPRPGNAPASARGMGTRPRWLPALFGAAVAVLVALVWPAEWAARQGASPRATPSHAAFLDAGAAADVRVLNGSRDVRAAPRGLQPGDVLAMERPRVLRSWVQENMPSLTSWTPERLSEEVGTVRVHVSERRYVKMHSAAYPFGRLPGLRWTRPWREREMTLRDLLRNESFADGEWPYVMLPLANATEGMRKDAQALQSFGRGVHDVLEGNLWVGTRQGLSTPCHYDAAHNLYLQLSGRKRFVLYPPSAWTRLYLFPRMHPSWRMTQVDFEAFDAGSFPLAGALRGRSALEVVLSPGDVLYLPPYWLHTVSVADGAAPSLSLSVHAKSAAMELIDRLRGFAPSLPPALSHSGRLAYLQAFVSALCGGAEAARRLVASVRGSRYAPLSGDPDVEGLQQAMEDARARFAASLRREELAPTLAEEATRAASQVAALREAFLRDAQFSDEIWAQCAADYIEDVVAHFLGPLSVAPFLDAFLNRSTLRGPATLERTGRPDRTDATGSPPAAPGERVEVRFGLSSAVTGRAVQDNWTARALRFTVGRKEPQIAALEMAALAVPEGERHRFLVPSGFAFGPKGSAEHGVAPYEDLVMDFCVTRVLRGKDAGA